MEPWLSVRLTIALFFVMFGIGLMFSSIPVLQVMAGSFLAALGLTFLFWVFLVIRER